MRIHTHVDVQCTTSDNVSHIPKYLFQRTVILYDRENVSVYDCVRAKEREREKMYEKSDAGKHLFFFFSQKDDDDDDAIGASICASHAKPHFRVTGVIIADP